MSGELLNAEIEMTVEQMMKRDDKSDPWVSINELLKRVERLEEILLAANSRGDIANNPDIQALRQQRKSGE